VDKAKPFIISKSVVWRAYERVKQNKGAAGVDEQSITDFEENLKDNLYKIWNRMSSGTYFPPPVRTVPIPKGNGGTRYLGVPTVADRIAQMIVKMYLEPMVEPKFHPNSYGYRPGKSAKDAVAVTRERCWKYDWVLELDIKGFFDNLDHELVMRAVRKHTDCRWILLYIERWLKAPAQQPDGKIVPRDKGTPQGGVISPLLANIFLDVAFDKWMFGTQLNAPFERYADDIVVHCATEQEAQALKVRIEQRFLCCKLQLHPEKTRIVYCKDTNRKGQFPNVNFDFLGFTFRPRWAKNKWGKYFVGFLPAISTKSSARIRETIRSMGLDRKTYLNIEGLGERLNPMIRGWTNYYGSFYRSAMDSLFYWLDNILRRWVMTTYRKCWERACFWLDQVKASRPDLLAHWCYLRQQADG